MLQFMRKQLTLLQDLKVFANTPTNNYVRKAIRFNHTLFAQHVSTLNWVLFRRFLTFLQDHSGDDNEGLWLEALGWLRFSSSIDAIHLRCCTMIVKILYYLLNTISMRGHISCTENWGKRKSKVGWNTIYSGLPLGIGDEVHTYLLTTFMHGWSTGDE
jgi:hypothetical protein